MLEPIIKGKVRILRPVEFEALETAINKSDHKTIIKTMLYSGMRYIELQRFNKNPDWLMKSSFHIHLPEQAVKKSKRKQKDRYVFLSNAGYEVVSNLIADKDIQITSKSTMNENLQRWAEQSGIGSKGISCKTFRKTWESWLVRCYPKYFPQICLSQGHTEKTSLKHYLNLPFTNKDKEKMQRYVGGIEW